MKRHFLVFLQIIFLSFLTISCSKKDLPEKQPQLINQTSTTLEEDVWDELLSNIGTVHNDAMDYVLQEFKNNNLFTVPNLDYNQVFKEKVEDYISAYLYQRGVVVDDEVITGFLSDLPAELSSSETSTEFKTATADIQYMLMNSTDPATFESDVETYIINMEPLSNNIEQMTFTASSKIAVSSYKYWTDHISDWDNEFYSQTNIPATPGRNIPGTGRADAAGGITGGIRGATVGGLGGLGGVLAGGILGAATGAMFGSLSHIVTHWPSD